MIYVAVFLDTADCPSIRKDNQSANGEYRGYDSSSRTIDTTTGTIDVIDEYEQKLASRVVAGS